MPTGSGSFPRDPLPEPAGQGVGHCLAGGGAVWFGTTGGASRFDGETWTTYTTADGLAHDQVNAIAIGPDGAVWFGTSGGVSRYVPPR
jgi:ligand-binding sensor domain-containing protein